MTDPKDKDGEKESGSGWDWLFGGPPDNMKEGQVMERSGSIGGGIQQEYTSVPTNDGDTMTVGKTSEKYGDDYHEKGHVTQHGKDSDWNNHYDSKK